jgi:hypothetical protein
MRHRVRPGPEWLGVGTDWLVSASLQNSVDVIGADPGFNGADSADRLHWRGGNHLAFA